MRTELLWTAIAAPFFAADASAQAADEEKPNVIVILADDIGYGDLGCYGATRIQTPCLDALARQGVRFTQVYSPASTSSPSRYALLTGEYAWRKQVGILPADAPLCIDSESFTLPRMFQRAGYCTALVGKWHLGLGASGKPVDFNASIDEGPLSVGFDYAYYFPATNDRVPCVYVENHYVDGLSTNDPIRVSYRNKVGNDPTGKENPGLLKMKPHLGHDGTIVDGVSRIGWMSGGETARWKDETMGEHLLGKVLSFIEKQENRPFFLYYAPHNAHEPRIPSQRFKGKSQAGVYGDVIEEFDAYVGELVDLLKRKGLYDRTLIVVTSDNAPMIKEGYQDGALEHLNGHNPYGKLRGEKYSLHEGGHRVPFLFSWAGHIKRPFVQSQPFMYMDLMATLAGLLSLDVQQEELKDGCSGAHLFIQERAPLYRDFILTQDNGGQVAIRKGKWKFLPATRHRQAELYNLESDPSELHNLVFAYPELVRVLAAKVQQVWNH